MGGMVTLHPVDENGTFVARESAEVGDSGVSGDPVVDLVVPVYQPE